MGAAGKFWHDFGCSVISRNSDTFRRISSRLVPAFGVCAGIGLMGSTSLPAQDPPIPQGDLTFVENHEAADPGFSHLLDRLENGRVGRAGVNLREEGAATSGIRPEVGMTLREMERKLIATTFARCGGNRERTAGILRIGLRTLSGKLREYGYPPRGGPGSNRTAAKQRRAA